ncbi:MAG: YggU family protein [Chloracidobacterium sp.]|nr:YggU family protein [Chloracidobacterium sp.]
MNVVKKDGSIIFAVRVVPRASKSRIVGEHDGALKVQLISPPVDGAANAELIRLMAKQFGVSQSDVEIVAGETSKSKRIKIANMSQSKFEEVIK